MTNPSDELIARAGYARPGFAEGFDEHRPSPPPALLDALCRLARVERPALVVDLGCGTGLSTRPWAERAERVVGIEPQTVMLELAKARTAAPNVEYRAGYAHATGVADGSADVVTCAQSFHWMEPEPALAEAARILRPGAVFAAYDYDVPPLVEPEVDAAFARYLAARREAGVRMGAARWPKHEHLARIKASGRFSSTRELVLHGEAEGGADHVVGFAQAIGARIGDAVTTDELEETARRVLGDRVIPWLVPYRVRLGIR
jgi:ubiquinone/menaquinone biosynthesis C-methylase UbiE